MDIMNSTYVVKILQFQQGHSKVPSAKMQGGLCPPGSYSPDVHWPPFKITSFVILFYFMLIYNAMIISLR